MLQGIHASMMMSSHLNLRVVSRMRVDASGSVRELNQDMTAGSIAQKGRCWSTEKECREGTTIIRDLSKKYMGRGMNTLH